MATARGSFTVSDRQDAQPTPRPFQTNSNHTLVSDGTTNNVPVVGGLDAYSNDIVVLSGGERATFIPTGTALPTAAGDYPVFRLTVASAVPTGINNVRTDFFDITASAGVGANLLINHDDTAVVAAINAVGATDPETIRIRFNVDVTTELGATAIRAIQDVTLLSNRYILNCTDSCST